MEEIANHGGLSPVDIIARVAAKIGAVASVTSLDQGDIRIGKDRGLGFREKPNEGVVKGLENQGWYRDTIDDTSTGGSEVIVVRIAEATVASNNLVVELTHRANGTNATCGVNVRVEGGLMPIATHESAEKVPLIPSVCGLMKGVRPGCEINRRTDGCHPTERRSRAPFSG
jgi:hypothetical protein